MALVTADQWRTDKANSRTPYSGTGATIGGSSWGGGGSGFSSGAAMGPGSSYGAPPSASAGGYNTTPLTLTAEPSPEMNSSIAEWQKRMEENQKAYNERMSKDTTQRSIDRATGSIRSASAGMGASADAAGARGGRGPGYGAAGIGDAAQMAQAKAASDISLGRERDLDAMMLSGQAGMNSLYGMNPYAATANLGLSQQQLGLQAYTAQNNAANQAAQTQAQLYGSPIDWYTMLMQGMSY